MKKNSIIFSSLLVLLPVFSGLLMWDKLPLLLPVHFNLYGEADGFASKTFAIILLPFILFAIHLVMVFAVSHDPKKDNINRKLKGLCLWICPAVSFFSMGIILSSGLEIDVPAAHLTFSLIGILFIVIGNYMPKCQMNYTVGIKLPWTLNDAENWRRTHRMAGPLWLSGGFFMLLSPFLGNAGSVLFLITVSLMVIVPVIYSYRLYKSKL